MTQHATPQNTPRNLTEWIDNFAFKYSHVDMRRSIYTTCTLRMVFTYTYDECVLVYTFYPV